MNSCLYFGRVSHRRLAPRANAFRYGLFMAYIDLDDLPALFDRYWLWSARRPALAWFRRADYLGDPQRPLADCVRELVLAQAGIRVEGPVRVLTHLRYFGHNFNPVTFYYCFDPAGGPLRAIVAEITNTPWKERHAYVLPVSAGSGPAALPPLRFEFDKIFHVSPFMPMDMRYRWRFSAPGANLAVYMENYRNGQRVFDASLTMAARPLNGTNLARSLLAFPFITMRVLAQIHWQALKLLLKRTPFHQHPAT